MSSYHTIISRTILFIGFLQITGVVSNPVVLSGGLRGETLGTNEGSQRALPSSQHQTQLHSEAEHESDPVAEQEPGEEPREEVHGESGRGVHEQTQAESQMEPNEEIQDSELDRGTRHLLEPNRNTSSVEQGTDDPEGLDIDADHTGGGGIPGEQQQMDGDIAALRPGGADHQLHPEESGVHEEPVPGEHISYLPDHSGPFPGESEGNHGDEIFPEDHLPTTPNSDMIHGASDTPIVRPIATESLPVELPEEHQHSGIGGEASNSTEPENGTDIFSNNKIEMSSKSNYDEQNETLSAETTTKKSIIDSSNNSVHEEHKENEDIISSASLSASIRPTPSLTSSSTIPNNELTETIDYDSMHITTETVFTSRREDDMSSSTTVESEMTASLLSVQSSYSTVTQSVTESVYMTSSGSGESVVPTYIPASLSHYDYTEGISSSASMDQSTTFTTVNSESNQPTVGSLSLASQGLVIHDNDGRQQTTTEENAGHPTSPDYYTSNNTPIYSYTTYGSSSTSHPDGSHHQTSVGAITELPSTSGSNSSIVTPPASTTTTSLKTTHQSDIVTLFLSTKKANHSSTKSQEKTARATTPLTGQSSPSRSTLHSTASSTTVTVKNPSTSHKNIHISTELPSVFISIHLQMTLTEFCSQKETFITELVEIVENHQQIDIQQQQVVLLNIRPKMCERLSIPFTDNDNIEEVKVELYFLDTDGKADEQMTKVVSEIIKQGFDEQSESRFKQKLTDVKLIHPNEYVSPVNNLNIPAADPETKLQTGITVVIVIASVGGFCCVCLLLLQIIIHRRQSGKRMKPYPGRSGLSNVPSMDSIALGVVPKSRPHSGFWNPGLEIQNESSEPTNLLEYTALSNIFMDTEAQRNEFETLSMEVPKLSSLPVGAEDKNRFANVIPFPHSRIKLKKIPEEDNSDYINANYISGYNHAYKTYIATQAPLTRTMRDFWRMVWEQQSRVILMLVPMQANGQPSCEAYWPDNEGMDACLQFGDITVALKKKDVQQEYTMYLLQLKDIENNLIREIHHFWYTSWPKDGEPEPISLVKFILDTRPHFEDSGAPVVVHCRPGTGRTGTLIAIDICMRSFEDRRKVDILNCVHSMRGERAGAVQTRGQYNLIYCALYEYATIVTSPKVSISSTASALHKML